MTADVATRLVLIRHGESASNAGGWLSGQDTCGGLTELGVAQAEALRDRLAPDDDLHPDAILVSTMRRAVHTAQIVAQPFGMEPEQHADLIERTSGEAEGLTIAEYTEEYPNRISGGQNQRAAIVRALMSDPEILLLDEVTSALDPELVGEVLGVIRELADRGLTMVLATHEMGFARDVANSVCFLHEGRVLESAEPARLFGDPQHERTQQFLRRVTEAGRL